MKKKLSLLLVAMLALVLTWGTLVAAPGDVTDPKQELHEAYFQTHIRLGYIEECYNYIITMQGTIDHSIIQKEVLDKGYLQNHIEDLKALGYIDADYEPPTNSVSTTTTAPAATPEPFTVEPMEPTTMWATQQVNCREGASTSYNKVGALTQYEAVTVTGVASTGWYQITKEDGTIVYVSNKYLSEEDPSDRTVDIYNEETGKIDTYEFEDVPPEVIDETVEQLKATPEPTVEPTPEPTAEPTPTVEPTAEPTPTPTVEEQIVSSPYTMYFLIGAMVFALFCAVLAVVMIKKRK